MKGTKDLFNVTILGNSLDQHVHPSTEKEPSWPDISLKDGEIVKDSILNVREFLRFLGLKLWLDEFENHIRIDGSEEYQALNDHVLSVLWGQVNELGFRPTKTFFRDALRSIAAQDTRHPLRERLKSLRWDGEPRAERLLIDYAHAEDNPVNRAIGKLLLVGMVRRIFEPGCKFDYIVILQGSQGCGKSMFCKTLAGGSEFFEESLKLNASVKQLIENTAGKWVVEIAELAGLTAKDIEYLKAQISRTVDRCRPAYGRDARDVHRQFVFLGTTNEEVFLYDSTGNRRCLPVRVSKIDIEKLKRDWDQLLAEACEQEKTYGDLIMPAELTAELSLRQKEVTLIEDSLERLSDYISDKLSVDPQFEFRKDELYGVMGVTKPTGKDGKTLASVTRKYGLTEKKGSALGKRFRYFVRQETAETEDA